MTVVANLILFVYIADTEPRCVRYIKVAATLACDSAAAAVAAASLASIERTVAACWLPSQCALQASTCSVPVELFSVQALPGRDTDLLKNSTEGNCLSVCFKTAAATWPWRQLLH